MDPRSIVIIPTYCESKNVAGIIEDLLKISGSMHILIVDDSSPDGTGAIVKQLMASEVRLKLLERPSKMGLGSAHRDGILWAYDEGYTQIATMDADKTHTPADLARLLDEPQDVDVVIASRFLLENSLPGWNLYRKTLTHAGHLLTKKLLGIPYDATGALRLYRTQRIPRRLFELASSNGYGFLIELLLILKTNNLKIAEIPVKLPSRILGSSKMTLREIKNSIMLIFSLALIHKFHPERLIIIPPRARSQISGTESSSILWDSYWSGRLGLVSLAYDIGAGFYRRLIIRPSFERGIRSHFPAAATLLHAGCGSGQVDSRLLKEFRIVGLDNSKRAIELYQATNGPEAAVCLGSINSIPFEDHSFAGVYNLGVMEHFTSSELSIALREFRRVLQPGGKLILWWPPEFGLSVQLLKLLSVILTLLGVKRRDEELFPAEISRIRSKSQVEELLVQNGFKLLDYTFGCADLFTQVRIIAEPGPSPL